MKISTLRDGEETKELVLMNNLHSPTSPMITHSPSLVIVFDYKRASSQSRVFFGGPSFGSQGHVNFDTRQRLFVEEAINFDTINYDVLEKALA